MAEYIDRDKLKYQLKLESCVRRIKTLEDVEKIIDFLPAADVAPVKHGKLISNGYDELYCEFGYCTVCDAYNPMSNKFCGQCGAKMDLEG